MHWIAQSLPGEEGVQTRLLLWGVALIAAFLALGLVVVWLRRSLIERRSARPGGRFDLEALRRLRDEGQLSPEEFRRLRNQALGLPAPEDEKAKKENPPLSDPPPRDDE